MVTLTVNVKYDKFPQELGWKIIDTVTLKTVVNYPAKTFYDPYKYLTGYVTLTQGRKYKLVMKDSFGDGICCTNGKGYIEVIAGSRYLVSIWGDIGFSYSKIFTP